MSEFSTYDYVAGGDSRQRLDVFKPTATVDLRTAVLVLHGGAFMHGDRTVVHARCQALADRGMTAVAVGYRLLDSAPWPAQLDDVRAALRWVGEHTSDLQIDAERLVLQGHSAGALLALLAAGTADGDSTPRVSAVVAYYSAAALSLTPGAGDLPAQMLLGPTATADDAAAASPITYIDKQFPPAALIHGAGDRLIPPIGSLRLFEALTAAGVRGELHLIAGQDHEFDMTPRYAQTTTEFVTDFLRAEVVEPEQAAQEAAEFNPFVSMPAGELPV